MSTPVSRFCTFVLCALLLAVPLAAQTVTGSMRGQVTDQSGGPLPGATITIRNMETGLERVVVTNEAGLYSAPFLPVGRYEVTANLEGMGMQTRRGIDLGLNQTVDQNFTMGVQVTETITIVAEQPRINTVNAEIKQSLTAREVEDKPSIQGEGRTAFLSLAETFAGFNENPTSGQNNPTASSGSSVNFGAGTRGTTFQINGVNNDDSSENQHRQGVALSTIKEFQVLTNNFSAEFGRGYGAVVLVQTKGGTNQLDGDLYGFYNDNEWNENTFFNRNVPLPDQQRTIMGVTAGFPLLRDRLFAYLSAEENKTEGKGLRTVDMITAEDLQLPRLTLGNDTPANRAFIDDIVSRMSLTPNRPDLSPRTVTGSADRNWPDEDYSGRLDFEPGASHHLSSRYQYSTNLRQTGEIIRGEGTIQDHDQSNLGLNWTHVFNSNVVGEFRYGLGIRDTNVNIRAGNDTPIVRFAGTNFVGTTLGSAGNFPIQRDQEDNQLVYNLSALLFTNHSFKAGADIRRQKLDDLADSFSRGFWSFNRICGGVTYPTVYHAFFAGCVRTFTKGYGNFFLENRIDEENLYAEDNWQVWPNLTLNLGVRYEAVSEPQEQEDRIDYGFQDTSYVDPRLGFAYTIGWDNRWLNRLTGGSGRSVIRGGYGVYHGRVFQSIFSQTGANLRFNPPNAAQIAFDHSTNIADPSEGFVFVPGQPLTRRVSITIVDPNLEMPSTKQWSITWEREMPWNSSLRLSYIDKKGEDLLLYTVSNLALDPRVVGPVTVVDHPFNAPGAVGIRADHPDLRGKQITSFNQDPCAGTGMPGVPTNAQCPVAVPLADNEFSRRVPRITERRPDPRYTNNLEVSNGNESEYWGTQIEWTKRFSNNLHFQASYTYSEYFDTGSEATFVGPGDSNILGPDRRYAWGRSRFDTPHRFTFYGSYRLPFFGNRRDFVGTLLGGWQIAPVVRYASGTPFTVITSGLDLDLNGFGEGRPVLVDRSIIGRVIDDPNTSQSQLPVSAFRPLQSGDTVEDLVPRNAFRTDDILTFDLGIYKSFALPWNHSLMLRLEGYNVTNEVQFGFPNTSIATPATFGRITGQRNSPRLLQVGLRYIY